MRDNFCSSGLAHSSTLLGGEKHLAWIVASVSQAYALMRCALNSTKVVLVLRAFSKGQDYVMQHFTDGGISANMFKHSK